MKYLLRNTTTNIIDLVFENPVPPQPNLDMIMLDDSQFRNAMVGSIFISANNYKPVPKGVDSNGTTYWRSNGTDWVDTRSEEEVWKMVKLRRNLELLECDWTQLNDAPITPPEQAQWNAYRNNLRQLPNNNADPRAAETKLKNLIDGKDEDGTSGPGRGKPPTDRTSAFPSIVKAARNIS